MTLTENQKLANFVPKLKCAPIFMKFLCTQSKSNILIINKVLRTDGPDPKIIDSGKFGRNTEVFRNFYEIWHLQQIQNAYYE